MNFVFGGIAGDNQNNSNGMVSLIKVTDLVKYDRFQTIIYKKQDRWTGND